MIVGALTAVLFSFSFSFSIFLLSSRVMTHELIMFAKDTSCQQKQYKTIKDEGKFGASNLSLGNTGIVAVVQLCSSVRMASRERKLFQDSLLL